MERSMPNSLSIVYVLTNPAMPNLVKIGRTTGDDANARISQSSVVPDSVIRPASELWQMLYSEAGVAKAPLELGYHGSPRSISDRL
jgi:hypothetical protein